GGGTWTWTLRAEQLTGRDEAPAEVAPTGAPAEAIQSPLDVPATPPEPEYPWQVSETPDLDLHGAPTWDPQEYGGQPLPERPKKRGRAAKWLFARAPEPEELPDAHPTALPAASLPRFDEAVPARPRPCAAD